MGRMSGQNVENLKLVMVFDETQVILDLFPICWDEGDNSKYLPIFKRVFGIWQLASLGITSQNYPKVRKIRTSRDLYTL